MRVIPILFTFAMMVAFVPQAGAVMLKSKVADNRCLAIDANPPVIASKTNVVIQPCDPTLSLSADCLPLLGLPIQMATV